MYGPRHPIVARVIPDAKHRTNCSRIVKYAGGGTTPSTNSVSHFATPHSGGTCTSSRYSTPSSFAEHNRGPLTNCIFGGPHDELVAHDAAAQLEQHAVDHAADLVQCHFFKPCWRPIYDARHDPPVYSGTVQFFVKLYLF